METLQEYALIAEIVSGIAVVFSLIYLGYQIRANTAELRLESIHSITTGYREQALNYVHNEALGIAWGKILNAEELTEKEVFLFANNLYSNLMLLEETYYRTIAGYLNEDFLNAKLHLIEMKILSSPQIRKQHEKMVNEKIYTPEFIVWLDSKLQRSELF